MNSDKLETVYKLLTIYNFDFNRKAPEEFKCGKCRKILIDACQIRCGCRFCRNCVDEMLNNQCNLCPGNTSDCKLELLSNATTDYRANKQISKLIVECPNEMCSYECNLLEMDTHLKICEKKSLNCPFYKFGCDLRETTNDILTEHIQLGNYKHIKILIDLIDNIRNEVGELREKELKNYEEIKQLKTSLYFRDEKLKSINKEMEMLKKENWEMENRLKHFERKLNNEITSQYDLEMQSLKTENEYLGEQMQIGLRNIWYKIDNMELELNKIDNIDLIKSDVNKKIEILQANFDAVESINRNDIKLINDDIELKIDKFKETFDKSIKQMRIEPRINKLENYVENKTNGIFELLIDNKDNELRNHEPIWSEYFHVRAKPYKLRLHIWRPSVNELWINLHVCDDMMNQILSFPFVADVTIKIISKIKREVCKSITKYCQIEKPKINSFYRSDDFIYSYSEMAKYGILESNDFIAQCSVELK